MYATAARRERTRSSVASTVAAAGAAHKWLTLAPRRVSPVTPQWQSAGSCGTFWRESWRLRASQTRSATTLPDVASNVAALGLPPRPSAPVSLETAGTRGESLRAVPLTDSKTWMKTPEVIEYYKAWLEALRIADGRESGARDSDDANTSAPDPERLVQAAESANRRQKLMSNLSNARKLSEDDKLLIAKLGDEASGEVEVELVALSEPDAETMIRFFGKKRVDPFHVRYARRPGRAATLAQWLAQQGRHAAIAPKLSDSDVHGLHAKMAEIDRKLDSFLSSKAEGQDQVAGDAETLSESTAKADKQHTGPLSISASAAQAVGVLTATDEVQDAQIASIASPDSLKSNASQPPAETLAGSASVRRPSSPVAGGSSASQVAPEKAGSAASKSKVRPSVPSKSGISSAKSKSTSAKTGAASRSAPVVAPSVESKTKQSTSTNSYPSSGPPHTKEIADARERAPNDVSGDPPSTSTSPAAQSDAGARASATSAAANKQDAKPEVSGNPNSSLNTGPASASMPAKGQSPPSNLSASASTPSVPPAIAPAPQLEDRGGATPGSPSADISKNSSRPSAAAVKAQKAQVRDLQSRVNRLRRNLSFANRNLSDAQGHATHALQSEKEAQRDRASNLKLAAEARRAVATAKKASETADESQKGARQIELEKAQAVAASADEAVKAASKRCEVAAPVLQKARSTLEAATDVAQLAKDSSDIVVKEHKTVEAKLDQMLAFAKSTQRASRAKASKVATASTSAKAVSPSDASKESAQLTSEGSSSTNPLATAAGSDTPFKSSPIVRGSREWFDQQQRKWEAMTDEASTSPAPLHGQIPPAAPPAGSGKRGGGGPKGDSDAQASEPSEPATTIGKGDGDGTGASSTLSTEGKRYLAKKAEEERRRRLAALSEANKIAFREKALKRLQEQQARKAATSNSKPEKKVVKPVWNSPVDSVVVHVPIDAPPPHPQVLEAVAASARQKDVASVKVDSQQAPVDAAEEVVQAETDTAQMAEAVRPPTPPWTARLSAMLSRLNLVRAFWQYIRGAWSSRVDVKPAEPIARPATSKPLTQNEAQEVRRAATEKFIEEVLEPSLGVFTDADGASCHMRFRVHLAQLHKKLVNSIDPEDEAIQRHEWLRWLQRDGIVIARHRNSEYGQTKKGLNDNLRSSARKFYNRWATQGRERTIEIFSDASFTENRSISSIIESGAGCKIVGVGDYCAPLPPGISTSGDAEIAAVVFATHLILEHLKQETLKLGRIPKLRLMFLTDCIGNLELVRTFWDIDGAKAKRIRLSQRPTANTEGLVRMLRNDLLMLRENFGVQITMSWLPRDTPHSSAADKLARKGRALSSKPVDYQPDVITDKE